LPDAPLQSVRRNVLHQFAKKVFDKYNGTMNATLEKSYSKASGLSDSKQVRLAEIMDELVEQIALDDSFEEDMKDPAYRAYVEAKAEQAEVDRLAGNLFTSEEILAQSQARVKVLHG
jgi:hypothetical protein